MNQEESLALFAKGKDAWNAYADTCQASRDALKAEGIWVEGSWEKDWNEKTRAWHNAAKADFSDHKFEKEADFSGYKFPGYAGFNRVIFAGAAGFGRATFEGDAGFEKTAFEGDALFGGTTFQGIALFDWATLGGDALFIGVTFKSLVAFRAATFEGIAWFDSVTFADAATFSGATFEKNADFRGTTFAGAAGFERTTFAGAAGFEKVTFTSHAGFMAVTFAAAAEFHGAVFVGNALFGEATFAETVRFGQTLFKSFTTFRDAKFKKAAKFIAMRGERSFSLAGAKFLEVPDFEQAHFEEAPRLDNVHIESEGLTPNRQNDGAANSKSRSDLAARWRSLKRLAIQGHDHARELDFFRGEIKAGRGIAGNFWPSVFSYPYEWFSDFGHSLVRPLVWWGISVLLFTGFYLGEHLARAYHAVSGIGGSIARIFSFAGTSTLDLSCIAGEGEPWLAAFGLSLRKGLLFFGLDSTGKLSQVYACLYGIYPKDESKWGDLPGSFSPIIPSFVAFMGSMQMLLSSILIFLFLLALRNHFRIR